MKMKKHFLLAALFLALAGAFPADGEAVISVDPSFQGTLMIVFPGGEILLVEPGEDLPEIPPQSTIQVFDGQATIKTDGDEVNVACLGQTGKAAGAVNLQCGPDAGVLKVLAGKAGVSDPTGKVVNVNEGEEYSIVPVPGSALPTGAGEEAGGPGISGALGDEPPVDSRSIEASPAT